MCRNVFRFITLIAQKTVFIEEVGLLFLIGVIFLLRCIMLFSYFALPI